MPQINEAVRIPVACLHPNEWNPNEQDEDTFNQLTAEIEEDGFDDPLLVVPCGCSLIAQEHYKIIGGEHRWHSAKVLGMEELPCFVKENWDEQKQKFKTVRRNLMMGALNPAKFTKLVMEQHEQGMDMDVIRHEMGFHSEQEFAKYLLDQEERREDWVDAINKAAANKSLDAIGSLSEIMNTIFKEAGDTVEQSYMFFTYGGSLHLLVLMDKPLFGHVQEMVKHLRETGENVTDYMSRLFEGEKNRSGDGE